MNSSLIAILQLSSGQTDFNKEQRLQGQINTHLNQTGKDQAAKAGQRLKKEHYDKVRHT